MKTEMSTLEKLILQCSSEIDKYILRSIKLSKKIGEHEFIIDILSKKVEVDEKINEFLIKYRSELSEYKLEYEWIEREIINAKNLLDSIATLNVPMKGEK